MKNLFIFGTSSTAKEILEVANQFYTNDFDSIKTLFFYNDSPQDLQQLELKPEDENFYIIGFADMVLRKLCINFMDSLFLKPFTIINPTSYIAPSSIIGEGCYIAANVSISSDVKLGCHCIVNLNSSVGHDSRIDQNVLILPGANISGNCNIHEKTLVGSNAFIYQGVTVGKNNSIDALTYIRKDLDDDMISISTTTKSLKKMTP
jgi:acetyltransferase EpsM